MNNLSKGQVMLVMFFFLALFLALMIASTGAFTASAREMKSAIASDEALRLAEAGLDEGIYQLNQSGSYSGESNTALGGGTFSVVVTASGSNKVITATGYVPNATNPVATKVVQAQAGQVASGESFKYGVQAGEGGFVLSGGAQINGNVYADGSINATSGVHITGSAVAADPPALAVDQSNGTSTIASCTSSTCITFGNASASQDVAQSFILSSGAPQASVSFYMEKVSTPGNLTVRIAPDNNGSPDSSTIVSATLNASSVSTSFGWVSVTLPNSPALASGKTYWIVLDGSTSSSKYYLIGATAGGYANGVAKLGSYGGTWSSTSPSGLDTYFQFSTGGGTSMIGGNTYSTGVYTGTTGTDVTWAHTMEGVTASGPLYCQTASYTNKSCDTSKSDPDWVALPVLTSDITGFEADAATGGTYTGNYTVNYAGATLGPKVITGNLLVEGGGTLTVTGTLYVKGSVTVTGGGKVQLSSTYGSNSGAIVTDGIVTINGGASFAGSGTSGSYPFVFTTSACPADYGCGGYDAVEFSGGAGAVALIAQNGTAYIDGGSALKTVAAQTIVMNGGATLTYDTGLANAIFSSGPSSGSWSFVPGTYVISP